MIGLETGYRYGEKFGITFDAADKHSIAALALGQMSTGTNTFTMANAYGVFGNNGLYTTPRFYTKVVDRSGKLLLESKIETEKVISPQAAFIMYDLLKEPVRSGTAYKANTTYKSQIPLAGKTGSSTNFKNLWFTGLTAYYSGAVWIENKNNQGIYSSDAAYIMGRIMNEAVKDLPVKDIAAPSGITSAAVDRVSGLLPTELSYKDPRGSQVYTELFIKDTVPTSTDNIHVEAKINKNNGKIASLYTPSDLTISKVFIKRDYVPTVSLGDQAYVLPKDLDDTVAIPTQPKDDDVDKEIDEDTAESIDDEDLDDSNLDNSNTDDSTIKNPNKNKNDKKNILDLFD
jgi:penicillin-binding protein 1A